MGGGWRIYTTHEGRAKTEQSVDITSSWATYIQTMEALPVAVSGEILPPRRRTTAECCMFHSMFMLDVTGGYPIGNVVQLPPPYSGVTIGQKTAGTKKKGNLISLSILDFSCTSTFREICNRNIATGSWVDDYRVTYHTLSTLLRSFVSLVEGHQWRGGCQCAHMTIFLQRACWSY